MSRVKPILFNTEMTRAILDGRKTVTRRVVKPHYKADDYGWRIVRYKHNGEIAYAEYYDEWEASTRRMKPPYQPGDTMYVRETWCWEPCWDCGMDMEEHNCCDESAHKIYNHNKREWGCYGYKASLEDNVYPSVDVWHPSIHMPKKAARIWLKVTDVRVERLRDIDYFGCINEGIPYRQYEKDIIKDFSVLWDSTIKKSDIDRYGWAANPFVWVIAFERCEKPESA